MKLLVKLTYMPLRAIFTIFAGVAAKQTFRAAWAWIDEDEPPSTTQRAPFGKILAASVLRAATSSSAKATADRLSARTYRYLFGAWPGK